MRRSEISVYRPSVVSFFFYYYLYICTFKSAHPCFRLTREAMAKEQQHRPAFRITFLCYTIPIDSIWEKMVCVQRMKGVGWGGGVEGEGQRLVNKYCMLGERYLMLCSWCTCMSRNTSRSQMNPKKNLIELRATDSWCRSSSAARASVISCVFPFKQGFKLV